MSVRRNMKKEHGKLEKYQSLREQLERMWGIKTAVVPIVIGAFGLGVSQANLRNKNSDLSRRVKG